MNSEEIEGIKRIDTLENPEKTQGDTKFPIPPQELAEDTPLRIKHTPHQMITPLASNFLFTNEVWPNSRYVQFLLTTEAYLKGRQLTQQDVKAILPSLKTAEIVSEKQDKLFEDSEKGVKSQSDTILEMAIFYQPGESHYRSSKPATIRVQVFTKRGYAVTFKNIETDHTISASKIADRIKTVREFFEPIIGTEVTFFPNHQGRTKYFQASKLPEDINVKTYGEIVFKSRRNDPH